MATARRRVVTVGETVLVKSSWRRWGLIAASVLAVAFVLGLVYHVLVPFLFSLGLAYLLDPLVTKLERRGVPRALGIVLIVVAVVLALVLVGFYVVPRAQESIVHFAQGVPSQVSGIRARVEPLWRDFDARHHDRIVWATERARTALQENLPRLLSPVRRVLTRAFSSFVNFFVTLVSVISVPVFTFYLLKDIAKIRTVCVEALPPRYRGRILGRLGEIDEVVSSFVRGQLIVATILAVIYMVGLGIIGVPGAVLVGIFCGYANLVPYLGIATGIPLASVLAFMSSQDFGSVIWVLVLFGVAQFIEGTVISPYVVGEKVGLHPVMMLLALMIWGELFGFVGLLVAVPATAALSVFVRAWYRSYLLSDFYRNEAIHVLS